MNAVISRRRRAPLPQGFFDAPAQALREFRWADHLSQSGGPLPTPRAQLSAPCRQRAPDGQRVVQGSPAFVSSSGVTCAVQLASEATKRRSAIQQVLEIQAAVLVSRRLKEVGPRATEPRVGGGLRRRGGHRALLLPPARARATPSQTA